MPSSCPRPKPCSFISQLSGIAAEQELISEVKNKQRHRQIHLQAMHQEGGRSSYSLCCIFQSTSIAAASCHYDRRNLLRDFRVKAFLSQNVRWVRQHVKDRLPPGLSRWGDYERWKCMIKGDRKICSHRKRSQGDHLRNRQ